MLPLQIKEAMWLSLNEDARRTLFALERWDLTFLKRRLVGKGHSAPYVETLVRVRSMTSGMSIFCTRAIMMNSAEPSSGRSSTMSPQIRRSRSMTEKAMPRR